jgi:hypothetical protein
MSEAGDQYAVPAFPHGMVAPQIDCCSNRIEM